MSQNKYFNHTYLVFGKSKSLEIWNLSYLEANSYLASLGAPGTLYNKGSQKISHSYGFAHERSLRSAAVIYMNLYVFTSSREQLIDFSLLINSAKQNHFNSNQLILQILNFNAQTTPSIPLNWHMVIVLSIQKCFFFVLFFFAFLIKGVEFLIKYLKKLKVNRMEIREMEMI